MNENDSPVEVQSPAQRMEILAALACLGCMVFLFSAGKLAMERAPLWWAKLLVYTLIPLTLTFTILYGSCIHREMKRAVRVLFLVGNSLLIFAGACLSLGIIAMMALAFMPLSRFHY